MGFFKRGERRDLESPRVIPWFTVTKEGGGGGGWNQED